MIRYPQDDDRPEHAWEPEDAVLYHDPPMGPEKVLELDRSAANAPEGSLQHALTLDQLDSAKRKHAEYTAAVTRRVAGDVATASTRRHRNQQNGEMIAQRAAAQKAEIQAFALDLCKRKGWTEPFKRGWKKAVITAIIEATKERNQLGAANAVNVDGVSTFKPEVPPCSTVIYEALKGL